MDRQIEQVLQALRDAKLEENTLIVFTSDHGELNGAHGLIRKGVFFEEVARVPFIVSLKGVTQPGLVDNQHLVSSGLDLIPTLCDFGFNGNKLVKTPNLDRLAAQSAVFENFVVNPPARPRGRAFIRDVNTSAQACGALGPGRICCAMRH